MGCWFSTIEDVFLSIELVFCIVFGICCCCSFELTFCVELEICCSWSVFIGVGGDKIESNELIFCIVPDCCCCCCSNLRFDEGLICTGSGVVVVVDLT